MLLENATIVVVTLTVITSGAVTKWLIESFTPRARLDDRALLVQLLVYGTLPFAVALLAYSFASTPPGTPKTLEAALADWRHILVWLGILFAVPVVQAPAVLFLGWVAAKLGLTKVHSVPSAWEKLWLYRDSAFVIVTVEGEDGRFEVGGEFSAASYAARPDNGGDLFLEHERVVQNGVLTERTDPPRGVWIAGDQIKAVRFFWGPGQANMQETKGETNDRQDPQANHQAGRPESGRNDGTSADSRLEPRGDETEPKPGEPGTSGNSGPSASTSQPGP